MHLFIYLILSISLSFLCSFTQSPFSSSPHLARLPFLRYMTFKPYVQGIKLPCTNISPSSLALRPVVSGIPPAPEESHQLSITCFPNLPQRPSLSLPSCIPTLPPPLLCLLASCSLSSSFVFCHCSAAHFISYFPCLLLLPSTLSSFLLFSLSVLLFSHFSFVSLRLSPPS